MAWYLLALPSESVKISGLARKPVSTAPFLPEEAKEIPGN